MRNSSRNHSIPDAAVGTSPLLTHTVADHLLRNRRILRSPPPIRGAAARLLRRASSRRMMLREHSMQVRENAAEQFEERQSDWGYSKPIIVLDVIWNLAFIVIGVVVSGMSVDEEPEVPLRLWIVGYGLQCLFHVGCVIVEYKRRQRRDDGEAGSGWGSGDLSDIGVHLVDHDDDVDNNRVQKHLESANTVFSFIWWLIGFYWVTAGGQNLTQDSPKLYWLCITFLACDVVLVIICVAVACLIGIAICCFLPCIIGMLYAMTDREGATEEEVDRIPKYKFCRFGDSEKVNGEIRESFGGIMIEFDADMPSERFLSHEEAECCICLSTYDDGVELRELPCHHHFHCTCIDKWLHINATCPLCKLNILKADKQIGSEDV